MVDIVPPRVRSRMMSGIRGRDTKPELVLRHGLHKCGFRYRLHARSLQGKPDLVFPMYRAVVFVNGCFWHGHDCPLFKWPTSRGEFWRSKISGNRNRDAKVKETLLSDGWRVLVLWECALKGSARLPEGQAIEKCAAWLRSSSRYLEVKGEI